MICSARDKEGMSLQSPSSPVHFLERRAHHLDGEQLEELVADVERKVEHHVPGGRDGDGTLFKWEGTESGPGACCLEPILKV